MEVEYIDFAGLRYWGDIFGNEWKACENLVTITMDNIGYVDTDITMNMKGVTAWSHDSMIDSLYTRSFDRAAAGYKKTWKIVLTDECMARLSEEEKAMIEAKGYVFG